MNPSFAWRILQRKNKGETVVGVCHVEVELQHIAVRFGVRGALIFIVHMLSEDAGGAQGKHDEKNGAYGNNREDRADDTPAEGLAHRTENPVLEGQGGA